MGKLNRLTSWILVAAMVLTLFSGVAPMAVHAEEAPAISAAYPEATELLTNMGIMNNSEKAWNEEITAEEANSLLLSVVFAPWWNFDTFGLTAMAADETVTGEKFLRYVNTGLSYGVGFDVVFSLIFHLTAGIDGYDPAAVLTREQAAQILNNFLKANPQYNQAELRGNALGLSYVKVDADELGRPTYQWIRTADGAPMAAAYAAKPIAVVNGGSTWNQIMAAAGFTGEAEAAIAGTPYWEYRMFNYALTVEGQKLEGFGSRWPGQDASTFYSRGWKIEIYPSYFMQSVFGAAELYWNGAVHDVIVYPAYLSDTYAEATDFMFHYLENGEPLMSNEEIAWTEQITAAEANKVIDALLYKSLAKYGWSHPLFEEGATVTGAALINLAKTYLGWVGDWDRSAEVVTAYFQLNRGIENYSADAALTREQAAQLFINILRAQPQYSFGDQWGNIGVRPPLKLNDDELGLTYEVTRDDMGRPSYQWKRFGEPITSVYAAKPIYVSNNAATTFGTIMNELGYDTNVENAWHYPMNKFGVRLINENIISTTGKYFANYGNESVGGIGMSVAVYDAFYCESYILEGNPFCSRMYDVVVYWDLLGDVQTIEGEKRVNMYGQPNGYGYWGGQVQFQNAEEGRYVVRWNQGQIQNVQKAESVLATLTAFDDATITIGDKVYTRSSRMYEGIGFLTAENLGKYFVFYFDTLGNVIGIDPAPSYTVNWVGADGTVLQSDSVYHGVVPTYNGETPVKAGDAQFSYTFTGWDAEPVAATQDATYTAQFAPVVNNYTVTWVIGDETIEETYAYGAMPQAPAISKDPDAENHYMAGWDSEIAAVTGDVTYTAIFTAEAHANGDADHNCDVCGEVLSTCDDCWDEGVLTPATFEKDAFTTYTCGLCGATKVVTHEGTQLVAVAVIGEEKFVSLAAAVAAAENGDTIELLMSVSGEGIVINKSITIDFGGFTYTFVAPAVGSTGTATNGFQILVGNTVTLKNGGLNVAKEAANQFYILIQNYANLTITDMDLDGTNLDKWALTDGDSYVVSNNSGTVNINGETNITANNDGDLAFAFDVCKYATYAAPVVNVNTTGTITGMIEVSAEINSNLNISGGTFTQVIEEAWCAEGFVPVAGGVAEGSRVTWFDEDGTVLYSTYVLKGETPTFVGEEPTKAEDADYTYTFAGWTEVEGGFKAAYTATEKEKPIEKFELYGANMDLGNKLDMNFYIVKADVTDEGAYVVITKYNADGSTTTKTIEKANWVSQSSSLWKVTFEGIAAKEMADKIEVVVYDSEGNAISEVREDGVRAYCERMLAKETEDVKKALYVDMLNYGAASQLNFNYNVEDLANANIDAYQKYATELAGLENNSNAAEVKAYYYGANMDLESSIKFNMYFLRSKVTSDMKVSISYTDHNGKAQTMEGVLVEQSKDLWKVTVDKLVVADAEQIITCVITDAEGNEVVTIVESMESYLARRSSSNELYNAIMKFGISAKAYLHRNDT